MPGEPDDLRRVPQRLRAGRVAAGLDRIRQAFELGREAPAVAVWTRSGAGIAATERKPERACGQERDLSDTSDYTAGTEKCEMVMRSETSLEPQ